MANTHYDPKPNHKADAEARIKAALVRLAEVQDAQDVQRVKALLGLAVEALTAFQETL